jgi:hypothetical protein
MKRMKRLLKSGLFSFDLTPTPLLEERGSKS